MYDIIIVGAGPSGLTAALYALRANKKVLVLESKSYGGQILNASKVENYPGIKSISGYDYATALFNQVKDLGLEYKLETVLKVTSDRKVYTDENCYEALAVILATGAVNRKLKLLNEDELIGKGISYCASCDGMFYKEKIVGVLGGGNSALEDAMYLSSLASLVYVIHRRSEFRGEPYLVSQLKKKDNVKFLLNKTVEKLNGKDKLESVTLKENETLEDIALDGLFIAVGQEPRNEIFNNVVDLDDKGYIISEDGVHTKTKGIYVAGDARVKVLRQLTTAVSDGSIASTTAIREMALLKELSDGRK